MEDGGATDGEPEFVPCEHQDGTRLKERFEESADGVRRLISIFDADLGVDCVPFDLFDGPNRCVPVRERDGDVVFGDDQCTESFVGFPDGERNPVVSTVQTSGCERLGDIRSCLLYTSPSPRDATLSRMPSSA